MELFHFQSFKYGFLLWGDVKDREGDDYEKKHSTFPPNISSLWTNSCQVKSRYLGLSPNKSFTQKYQHFFLFYRKAQIHILVYELQNYLVKMRPSEYKILHH